jgi:Ca2+-binding RTX toxin-like protein
MSTNLYRRLWFEGLESRRVLAAGVTLVDGVLTVEGTNRSDAIVVTVSGEFGDTLSVFFNRSVHSFQLSQVSELQIHAGGGNDKVWIADNVELLATVFAGNGNDWLKGGGGRNEFFGGKGNDHLVGSEGDDLLVGEEGNDRVWGLGGQDHLEGNAGNDHLDGGDGDDLMFGDAGQDKLKGGAGSDEMWGGFGHDHLSGGDDNDVVHGEAGKDHLHGGLGDDQLFGEDGKDHIDGNEGNDWLDGGGDKDKLWGGLGDDNIKGGAGNDHLNGGEGNNLLDGDEGNDKLIGGTEFDFDAPPPPPPEPEVVEYITYMQSEGGMQAQLVYTNSPLGDGHEEVLHVHVNNGYPLGQLLVTIGGVDLGYVNCDENGTAYLCYSTVCNDPGEQALPEGFGFVDGASVNVGPELHGFLNLSEVSDPL